MIEGNSVQMNCLPSLDIRALTLILVLVVGVMSTSVHASETGKASAAVQTPSTNQGSATEPQDISERLDVISEVEFAPCPENPRFDCGTLNLPVDYHKPFGDRFKMAVVRARATNPAKRIGVLMINPGGPGISGVDFILAGEGAPSFERVRERFDMVSFDVRGSGRSHAVKCEVERQGDPSDFEDATLIGFFDAFSRKVAKACLQQNGPFILSMSTNNIARDMDVLRRALGERQITYAGISYGTALGSVYASLFPKRVRGMLLDAAVAPEFRDQRVEFRTEQAASFESTFHRLDQLCRKDTNCRLHEAGILPAFDKVVAQLKDQPITSGGVVLDDGDIVSIVDSLLSIEPLWFLIVDALADANGGDFTLFFQLLSFSSDNSSSPFLTFGALTAIQCNDFGTRRSASEYLPVDAVAGVLYPRTEGRFKVATSAAVCAAWSKPDLPIIRNVKNRLENPIMLIGNDFDPNTPLSWTRSLARALGMERNITRYQGGGHTAYIILGNECIDRAGDTYLFDLTLPAEGLTCPAEPIRFTSPAALTNGKRVIKKPELDLLRRLPSFRH